jgi:hypothetical protein
MMRTMTIKKHPGEKVTGRLAHLREAKNTQGKVLPLVKEMLVKRSLVPSDRRQDCLHPSEMAKADWCPRASYFRITGNTHKVEMHSFNLENIFAEGNMIHEKWQRWLKDTGDLWGDWYCARCGRKETCRSGFLDKENHKEFGGICAHAWEYHEVTLAHPELNIYGHEDGALVSKNCLVEFKSVGLGTLRHENPGLLSKHYLTMGPRGIYDLDGVWKSITRPMMSHVRQVNIYLWLAQQMGLPFDSCAVVYEYKVNQQVKEFEVKLSEQIMEPILRNAQGVRDGIERGFPPVCPQGEDGCKYCTDDA